jgi:hypothetical protein
MQWSCGLVLLLGTLLQKLHVQKLEVICQHYKEDWNALHAQVLIPIE